MAVLQLSFLQQCFGREGCGFIEGIAERGKLIPACSISELENNSSVTLQKVCLSTAAWIKSEGSLTLQVLREGKEPVPWLSKL